MENIEICLPVKFISAGQFVAPEKWIHQRRTLDCYTLYLVEKQHFSMRVDEREYDLHPHKVLIIPPGCEHEGKYCGADSRPVYYWAHFQPSENAAKSAQSIVLAPHSLCGDYNRIAVVFRELISESRGASPKQMACDFQMSLLLIYLSNTYAAPQTQNALFFRIKEYIRLHYRQGVTLQELSEKLNYNADYISRLFRKNQGVSVSEYQRILRLSEAKQLLLTSVDSVREIGYSCGFSNEKFFMTSFSKQEGMTPTQYRNLYSFLHQNES